MGGLQMQLIIAVDFTSSNGKPTDPSSLHYNDPTKLNIYEQAIYSVGQILLQYDADQRVPMYGFGGKIQGNVNHCFPLNFNWQFPEVFGLQGIMGSYRQALNTCELSGPTLFGQVLQEVVSRAEKLMNNPQQQNYIVLLILTDGVIHDMQIATDLVVKGSSLPLSIIIVGIGNDDFENMNILDADEVPLVDKTGKKMSRDIVQFVAFRDFGNDALRLQNEVLKEIPDQVSGFYKYFNITPNVPIQQDLNWNEVDTNRSFNQTLTRQNSNEMRIKNYQNQYAPQDIEQIQIQVDVLDANQLQQIPEEPIQQENHPHVQTWFQGQQNFQQPYQTGAQPQFYATQPQYNQAIPQFQPGQQVYVVNANQQINPQANMMAVANYPQ